jgi:hypothetical protein
MTGRKSVQPCATETAFDCPHCGAYTTHTWFDLTAKPLLGDRRSPGIPTPEILDVIGKSKEISPEHKLAIIAHLQKVLKGLVTVERNNEGTYVYHHVDNVNLSQCFNCDEVSVWVNSRVMFPTPATGPAPNVDLPANVLGDYDEASRILNVSPRGSAALLRLAIQKLCVELGGKGRSIDDDIKDLVKKGLPPVVQKALDSVRVIGNEAVHPGTLDLKDDIATASSLFSLVNIIAEQMISNPKHVDELYAKLPEEKRNAIDKRDGK